MAKGLILQAKNSFQEFRLIGGTIKSDMDIPVEKRGAKIQERLESEIAKIKAHIEQNPGDEIVIKGLASID